MESKALARSSVLLVAWGVVGALYAAGVLVRLARDAWAAWALVVALAAATFVTIAAEVHTPAGRARRWRLAWCLGSFHVAFVSVAGARDLFFANMVNAEPLRALLIWAAAVLLAGAALRPFDLDGGLRGLLAIRAALAGVAMGLWVLAIVFADASWWVVLVPSFFWLYAVPTGMGWALAFWVIDTAFAWVARRLAPA